MSSDGKTVAIGAPFENADAGQVRVYKLQFGVWTQLGNIINGDLNSIFLGYSVSLSSDGTIVAAGAPQSSSLAGTVRIYKLANNVWTQLGIDISGAAPSDESGFSVSLSSSGSIVAIGSPFNGGNGSNSGHVRVYKFINSTWTQQGADINGDAAGDQSGYSVALSDNGLVGAIGAIGNDVGGSNSGNVRIYRLINNVWTKQGLNINGDAAGDLSGYSVALASDGNTVAIGAPFNDGTANNSGNVRIYRFINSTWTKLGGSIGGLASGNQNGHSVSLSSDGRTVAIGAPFDVGFRGYVRVYKLENNIWTQLWVIINGEAAGDQSGFSVSLSSDGSIVAIGAPFNDGNGSNSGHVRVYRLLN